MVIWLSQHIDTAHSRTLRSCEGWVEYREAGLRWLRANGGLVDYYCPRTGDREVFSAVELEARVAG